MCFITINLDRRGASAVGQDGGHDEGITVQYDTDRHDETKGEEVDVVGPVGQRPSSVVPGTGSMQTLEDVVRPAEQRRH